MGLFKQEHLPVPLDLENILPFLPPSEKNQREVSRQLDRHIYCAVEGKKTAKCSIVFQHGLRGHGMLYAPYAEYQSQTRNTNVVLMDLPAHGISGGQCRVGHILYMQSCVEHAILQACAKNKSPVILEGHSVGGLIVLYYAFTALPPSIRRRIAGIVGIDVPLCVGNNVKPWRLWLAPILAYLFPRMELPELVADIPGISPDPEVQRKIREDSLIYKGPLNVWTAYTINEMTKTVRYHLWKHFHKNDSYTLWEKILHFLFGSVYGRKEGCPIADIPILLLRGEDDKIAGLGPYEEWGIPVESFPKLRHDPMRGEGSDAVIKRIDEWIDNVALPSYWERRAKEKKNKLLIGGI
jgi:pimeloyl-ACP methyl ester carboxylesterase